MMSAHMPGCACHCSKTPVVAGPSGDGVSRREFLYGVGAFSICATLGTSLPLSASAAAGGFERAPMARAALGVQPVLSYEIPRRRDATSWRNWGGIRTEEHVAREK